MTLDMEKGLMYILSALMQGMEEALTKERAMEIAYKAGYKHGEKIGQSMGHKTPDEAIKSIIAYLSSFQKVKIADVHKKGNSVEYAVRYEKCVVLETATEKKLQYPTVSCKYMQGFWEGILENMSGAKARKLVYLSSISKMCIGTITLEGLEEEEEGESSKEKSEQSSRTAIKI